MADFTAIRAFLDQGEIAHGESLAQTALESEKAQAELWEILGRIAARLGEDEFMQRYFERSRSLGGHPSDIEVDDPREAPPHPRYLLIKSWGFGFWADVACSVGHLCLAEMTGRIPVVHWGRNCLYRDGREGDAFCRFFEPVSDTALTDICSESFEYFPPKWNSENLRQDNVQKQKGPWSRMGGVLFLNRPEHVCVVDHYTGVVNLKPWISDESALHGLDIDSLYRRFFDRYIIPQRSHLERAERFVSEKIGSKPFVAIHLRGTDKVIENRDNDALNRDSIQLLDGMLAGLPRETVIFLMTDDTGILQDVTARYGSRTVFTDCERRGDQRGVHQPSTRAEKSGYQLGVEVLLDVLIACKAAAFVGNGTSNASLAVKFMGDFSPDACHLLGRNWFHTRFTNIYKP